MPNIRTLDLITRDKTKISQALGAETPWDQYGGLEIIATDQGAGFANDAFRAAVIGVGGSPILPPAGLPQLRAHIERVFGTFSTDLMPFMLGRTFSNPMERGDYDTEGKAVLTDDILAAMFVRYVVDIYHNSPHEGLGGDTPANRWKSLAKRYDVQSAPDKYTRRAVFGETVERKISGRGVRICGLYYACKEVHQAPLHSPNRTVRVRVDVLDIGYVSVELQGRWYSAKSILNGFDDVGMQSWLKYMRDIRAAHRTVVILNQDLVDRAQEGLRNLNAEAMLRENLTPSRISAERIDAEEKQLFLGIDPEYPEPNNTGSDPLFQNSIPVPRCQNSNAEDEDEDVHIPKSPEWRFDDE